MDSGLRRNGQDLEAPSSQPPLYSGLQLAHAPVSSLAYLARSAR
jgi:hypothetical protein